MEIVARPCLHRAMTRIVALLAALALPVSAFAGEPFDPTGVWLFRTDAVRDGAPVCSELWDFQAGGVLRIESGQERVEKRWRVERESGAGYWIVTETVSTNGLPDCMGESSPAPAPGERRTFVVPLNNGVAVTCPPPGRMPDGALVIGDCYGRLTPADQAG